MRMLLVVALTLPACSDSSSKTPDAAASDAAPSTCTGACRTLTAKAVKGLNTVTFDRAFYGYNGGAAAPTSLRIELHHRGDASCPLMGSPRPDQTAIVSAIPVANRTVPTSNLTAKVSYLDFAGTLTTTAIVRSTAVSLSTITSSFVATDLYVAFDINASLGESISVTGHVFAIHCAYLDEML